MSIPIGNAYGQTSQLPTLIGFCDPQVVHLLCGLNHLVNGLGYGPFSLGCRPQMSLGSRRIVDVQEMEDWRTNMCGDLYTVVLSILFPSRCFYPPRFLGEGGFFVTSTADLHGFSEHQKDRPVGGVSSQTKNL